MIELKTSQKGYRLQLSGELGYEQLPDLLATAQQIDAQPKPTTIEWSDLKHLHYACVQVLLALGKRVPLKFKEPSPELHQKLNRYGIWQALLSPSAGDTPSTQS
jgi:ABC-type transporter Mla MlaB component